MYWKSKGSTSWASGISRFITGVNVNIAPKPIPYNLHLWQICSARVLQTQDGERCRLFFLGHTTMMTMKSLCWRQKLSARQKWQIYVLVWCAQSANTEKQESNFQNYAHYNHSRLLPQKTFLPIPDSKCSNPLIRDSECSNSRWYAQGFLSVLLHILSSGRKELLWIRSRLLALVINDDRRWGGWRGSPLKHLCSPWRAWSPGTASTSVGRGGYI